MFSRFQRSGQKDDSVKDKDLSKELSVSDFLQAEATADGDFRYFHCLAWLYEVFNYQCWPLPATDHRSFIHRILKRYLALSGLESGKLVWQR